MTNQPLPSWDAVIACHDPTQPTRYYRAYTLHYPADSSERISATLHHTLAQWSTETGLILSTQYPLLAISEQHTTTITASSLNFDQLLDFDAALRQAIRTTSKVEVLPSTLETLQADLPTTGPHAPRSTLEIITQLQSCAFELDT